MDVFTLHRRQAVSPASAFAAGCLLLALWGAAGEVLAQQGSSGQVFTCVTANGRRLTSDRPIAECSDREQRQLGRNGTLVRVVPPSYTAEERAAREAADHKAAAERAAQTEAARFDRNLQRRYPNEAAHNKARASALADVQAAINSSKTRLAILADERKPMDREVEFYKGKTIPVSLKRQIDTNDVTRQAVIDTQANNEAELKRVNTNYDLELERLRKLWAGAAQGSLGTLTLTDKPEPKTASKPGAAAAKAASAPAAKPSPPVKR